jgi:glycosyltransferase involved in cell wall biosynthesis
VRIAIVTWNNRKLGGTETYLGDVITQLHELGHELSLLHEVDVPATRDKIAVPPGALSWCVAELGADNALASLRSWRPDLIFSHGLHDPRFEKQVLKIAPAVLFAHDYYGTCISGEKINKYPVPQPCTRRFGAQCLLHYLPRGCGGFSPITMVRLYQKQKRRLANVNRYAAVVTHSSHMRDEYVRQGCDPRRIHNISYYSERANMAIRKALAQRVLDDVSRRNGLASCRLLFLGRMSFLKGGKTFMASLPRVHELLQRPVHVTFAGEGPERQKWEKEAARLTAQHDWLKIEFPGWLARPKLDSVFSETDLLVFPSLWPEPFGLIGLEAGHRSVPIAAFAVGGIPDWLFDGVNGHLAPGNPPTAKGLAEAIAKCLRTPGTHRKLKRGAFEVSKKFSVQNHLANLLGIFHQVVEEAHPKAFPNHISETTVRETSWPEPTAIGDLRCDEQQTIGRAVG